MEKYVEGREQGMESSLFLKEIVDEWDDSELEWNGSFDEEARIGCDSKVIQSLKLREVADQQLSVVRMLLQEVASD